MKRRRAMTIALLSVAGFYLLVCLALWFFQEVLLFPGSLRHVPRNVPTPHGVVVEELETADGTRFHVAVGRPVTQQARGVLVYFVGNAETLLSAVHHAAKFARYGLHTVVPEYPGYGNSDGKPGKASILAAADASGARAQAIAKQLSLPLMVAGHSLGSFSAVHLARQGVGTKLLLLSPPTRMTTLGQRLYRILPVGLLLRHDFDNLSFGKDIHVPTLVIHGEEDGVVPLDMGKELAAAIPGARFRPVPERGHNDLFTDKDGALGELLDAFWFE